MISISSLFEGENIIEKVVDEKKFRKKFDQGSLRYNMMLGSLIAPASLAAKTAFVDKDILNKLNQDHTLAAPAALAAASALGAGSAAAIHGVVKSYFKVRDKIKRRKKQ